MVRIKSESDQKEFLNEINQKNQSIKFDYKLSKESIEFQDTWGYINRLQTTLFKKPTNCQNYLHANSSHLFSLKKVFPRVRHSKLNASVQLLKNRENISKA